MGCKMSTPAAPMAPMALQTRLDKLFDLKVTPVSIIISFLKKLIEKRLDQGGYLNGKNEAERAAEVNIYFNIAQEMNQRTQYYQMSQMSYLTDYMEFTPEEISAMLDSIAY